MFKELHPLAEASPLHLIVAAEAGNLRVTVAQQKNKLGIPLSLSILATPEELDAELPAAIALAGAEIAAPRSVKEQVESQVAAAKASAGKPDKSAAPKKTAPAKPAATKPAKPTAEKKPGKPECLADLAALQAKHGDKLTRDQFIKESATGRRFENLWGTWTKFLEAGKRAASKAAAGTPNALPPGKPAADETPAAAHEPPNGDDKTLALPLDQGSDTGQAAPDVAVVPAQAGTHDAAADSAGEAAAPAVPVVEPPPAPKGRTIETLTGRVLDEGSTNEYADGDTLNIYGKQYRVRMQNERTVFVDEVIPEPPRKVIDEDGESPGTYTGKVNIGDEIAVGNYRVRVKTCTAKAIFVEHINLAQEAA